jgi:hypothetical protein
MRYTVAFLSLWMTCLTTSCSQRESSKDTTQARSSEASSEEAFLDSLQKDTFGYFWETTNAANGLIPDRAPSPSFSSIAAIGFGLSAYLVGVERGYVSRDQATQRVLTTLRFLWKAPQNAEPVRTSGYQGFFYHFLDMQTGERFKQVELSTIDTVLMLGGVLSCQTYFDRDSAEEREIRQLADDLYKRVNWPWFQVRKPVLSMGWHPESGFIPSDWKGYNEAMLLYVLALASPTHPIEPDAWNAWTQTYDWMNYREQEHVNFAPLFGHQYSHLWIDFRGIQDDYMRSKGIDYFENSRRATLANRAYCVANPMKWKNYGPNVWGLTACDGPKDTTWVSDGTTRQFFSYRARGASGREEVDDGTLTPTAAGGSVPFAPEVCIPALRAMKSRYGDRLYGQYGFYDAFNPSFPPNGWFDVDYLGIDQGPILLMIENHRSGFLWKLMQKNPYIQTGLRKAGFKGGWLDGKQ